MVNNSANVTYSVRSFHVCGPATGKIKLGYQQLTVCW